MRREAMQQWQRTSWKNNARTRAMACSAVCWRIQTLKTGSRKEDGWEEDGYGFEETRAPGPKGQSQKSRSRVVDLHSSLRGVQRGGGEGSNGGRVWASSPSRLCIRRNGASKYPRTYCMELVWGT